MASSNATFRLRKATDIRREYATFELLADDVAILDMGFSDEGIFDDFVQRANRRIHYRLGLVATLD
jgi:hypothetical protein